MNCTRDSRCDGHGVFCTPLNICKCDDGWTALGDFWIVDGAKCDINKKAMMILAITEAVMACTYLLVILHHLPKKYAAMRANFFKFLWNSRIMCIFFCILVGISDVVISLSSITQRQPEIFGENLISSVAATLHSFLCFLVLSTYFQIIVNYLASSDLLRVADSKTSCKVLNRLAILRNFSWCVIPFSIPITLSATLSKVDPINARPFAHTFIIGIGVLTLIYGIFFLTALRYMIAELSSHIKKINFLDFTTEVGNLPLVCRRLKVVYYCCSTFLVGGSGIMILFGSWDYLFRKYAYLSVVARLIVLIIFTLLYISISGTPPPTISPRRSSIAAVRKLSIDIASLYPSRIKTKINAIGVSAADTDGKESMKGTEAI